MFSSITAFLGEFRQQTRVQKVLRLFNSNELRWLGIVEYCEIRVSILAFHQKQNVRESAVQRARL